MQDFYFYMWRHPYTGMTCFGITKNEKRRRVDYEGHNGFDVEWSYLISANGPTILELEKSIKRYIKKLDVGYKGYEWIDSSVDYSSIEKTVEYLIKDKIVKNIKSITNN